MSIVKDKANHAVVLDKQTSERLYKDVQSYRLITVATLVDRLKINGSIARQALNELEEKGLIKKVLGHSKMNIYSMLSSQSTMMLHGMLMIHSHSSPRRYRPVNVPSAASIFVFHDSHEIPRFGGELSESGP